MYLAVLYHLKNRFEHFKRIRLLVILFHDFIKKATVASRVTGGPDLGNLCQDRIFVAVGAHLLHILVMSAGSPLNPQLAPASAEISHTPGL